MKPLPPLQASPGGKGEPSLLVLLALSPVLFVMLLLSARPAFVDVPILDEMLAVYPTADRLTTGTMELLGSWEVGADGARPTEPGASLRLEVPEGPWRRVHLMVNGSDSGEWGIRLSRDFQRNTTLGIVPGREEVFEGERLPGAPGSWSPLGMELFPQGDGSHRVNRVGLRLSVADEFEEPSLPGLVMGALLPVLLAGFFRYAGRRTRRQAVMTGGIFGSVAAMIGAWQPENLVYLWAAGAAFALGGASGALFKRIKALREGDEEAAEKFWRAFQWLAFAAVMAFALQARWEMLGRAWSRPLSPDALGYAEIALTGSFYETLQAWAPWVREPLFPAWLRLWFSFAPISDVSARVAGIIPGLAVVALVFLLGRRLFSPVVGLLAAGFLAVNEYVAGQAVEGLRDDLLVALFLGLAVVVVHLRDERWKRAIAWGMVGAGLGLIRVNALVFLLVVGAVEARRRRWLPWEILLAIALAVLPILPHLAFNARISGGDFMYSSNVHTRYYHNLLNLGGEGFPADFNAWQADPYAGEVVGTAVLLAEPHLFSGVARVARGMVAIFLKDFPHYRLFGGQVWLMLPALAGLWVLWQRRDAWWFFLWTVFFLAPVALIAGIRFDHRLALPAAPAIVLLWSAGVFQLAVWAWEFARRKRGGGQPGQASDVSINLSEVG
jgi:hypothetical protein